MSNYKLIQLSFDFIQNKIKTNIKTFDYTAMNKSNIFILFSIKSFHCKIYVLIYVLIYGRDYTCCT